MTRLGRLLAGLLMGSLPLCAAELSIVFQPTWKGEPVEIPSAPPATGQDQRLRITRLSALVSEIALLRADQSVVELDNQFGFVDAASGRLSIAASGVPRGSYAGLQVRIGLPAEIDHADIGRWPGNHPLNPLVNRMYWGWRNEYVFLALEGLWGDGASDPGHGFSYHLAATERPMRVRFLAPFTVEEATRVTLSLELASVIGGRRLSASDGSASLRSEPGDAESETLARGATHALFWRNAEAVPRDVGGPAPSRQSVVGHPVAFTVPQGFPQPVLPPDNPLTEEGIALGRSLFSDTRLSGTRTQTCASCHDPARAFSDRAALSIGADGRFGRRNAPSLLNLAWQTRFAWDGSKPRIRDQVRAAITGADEMHGDPRAIEAALSEDPHLRRGFCAAFGTGAITLDRACLALEQYLLTLVSADSAFDRARRGQEKLPPAAQRGMELFFTEYDPAHGQHGADCFHCHGGPLFSDFGLRDDGLKGRPGDPAFAKTPSLRNAAVTGPYMHDGRIATLEEVVAHYDHGLVRSAALDPNLAKHPEAGMGLSADDQAALVAFLRSLTDPSYARGT